MDHRPIDSPARSRDFGSPQCRLRLYVLGAQESLIDWASFQSMMQFFGDFLSSAHSPSTISQVVDWVHDQLGSPPSVCVGNMQQDLGLTTRCSRGRPVPAWWVARVSPMGPPMPCKYSSGTFLGMGCLQKRSQTVLNGFRTFRWLELGHVKPLHGCSETWPQRRSDPGSSRRSL